VGYYSRDYSVPVVSGVSRDISRALRWAAKPFRVRFADGYGELRRAALHSGGNSCNAGLLTQLGGRVGTCGVHPSYAGQALLSQALERAIKLWSLYPCGLDWRRLIWTRLRLRGRDPPKHKRKGLAA
jgi:hypothetical protein